MCDVQKRKDNLDEKNGMQALYRLEVSNLLVDK